MLNTIKLKFIIFIELLKLGFIRTAIIFLITSGMNNSRFEFTRYVDKLKTMNIAYKIPFEYAVTIFLLIYYNFKINIDYHDNFELTFIVNSLLNDIYYVNEVTVELISRLWLDYLNSDNSIVFDKSKLNKYRNIYENFK